MPFRVDIFYFVVTDILNEVMSSCNNVIAHVVFIHWIIAMLYDKQSFYIVSYLYMFKCSSLQQLIIRHILQGI